MKLIQKDFIGRELRGEIKPMKGVINDYVKSKENVLVIFHKTIFFIAFCHLCMSNLCTYNI